MRGWLQNLNCDYCCYCCSAAAHSKCARYQAKSILKHVLKHMLMNINLYTSTTMSTTIQKAHNYVF